MNRRDFIRFLLTGTAGILASKEIGKFEKGLCAFADLAPDIVVAKGSSPDRIIKAAIESFGGIGRFISRGDTVLIKPNIAWDRTPNLAATTNPELVAGLVRLCFDAGAKEVRVLDRTCNDARRCYVSSGIAEAAKSAGARVSYANESKTEERKINGNVLNSWPVLIDALEVDKIINVPIAKVHGASGLTLGMKNWFGAVGGNRSRLHQNIHYSIPELSSLFKPALVVLDAIRILKKSGPAGGDESFVERLNTLVVGKDQVAVDAYGATLFGKKPEEFSFVINAHKMGLGEMDLEKLSIKRIALS